MSKVKVKPKKAYMRSLDVSVGKNGYMIEVCYNYDSDKESDRYIAGTIDEVAARIKEILKTKKSCS